MNTKQRPALVEYLDNMQKPGHGYGHGCTIVKRQTRVVEGVEFLALTVVEPNDETERVYLTGDGFLVEPIVGDSNRWSVSLWDKSRGRRIEEWARKEMPGMNSAHHGVQFVRTLKAAATMIKAIRQG